MGGTFDGISYKYRDIKEIRFLSFSRDTLTAGD